MFLRLLDRDHVPSGPGQRLFWTGITILYPIGPDFAPILDLILDPILDSILELILDPILDLILDLVLDPISARS